jgi:CheY-like chemotaxis protein
LVADDDETIRVLLGRVLSVNGFEVLTAGSGREALNRFLSHPSAVAAALLDVQMPGWSGPQTLAALRRFDPRLICCFMSADPFPFTEEGLLALGAARYFQKPLSAIEVAEALRQLTGRAGPPD